MLATGYLFSALIVIPHALTFPSAFAPTGLLGAGPQSSAWLNVSWRFGLAVATATYAFLRDEKYAKEADNPVSKNAIYWSVTIVIIVVCTLTWIATAGHSLLPVVLDNSKPSLSGRYANGIIGLTYALTLSLLWARGSSVLDL